MIPDSTTARRWFLWLLAVTTLVRLALAAGLPITGDEAYFVLWGRHPALGYYDHPPMVGWWLAAMLQVSDALWWLRLPAILVTVLVGTGLVWMLREIDARLAWLTGALFLASPLPLLHVVITTDTPVVLFGFLSAACFWRGVVRERLPWFLLAGLFLGLGLLSKYFAGLLALAYVAWWFLDRRKGWLLLGLLLTGLVSAALFALNLWWNWQHCWDNFLFNFLNRNSGSVPWYTPLLYLLTLTYVLSPPVVWYALRRRAAQPVGPELPRRVLAVLAGVPLALLGLLSLGKVVGIHWLLGFHALVLAWLALARGLPALWGSLRFNLWFSLLHVLLLGAVVVMARLPEATLPQDPALRHRIVDALHGQRVWQAVAPLADDRALFMHSYAAAAEMSYHAGRHVGVFGEGSYHAREDDRLTDFRRLDGRDFLIILNRHHDAAEYAPFFERVRLLRVPVLGTAFEIVLGDGFKYEAYRERVLKRVNERFYRIPPAWPTGHCGFKERYRLP